MRYTVMFTNDHDHHLTYRGSMKTSYYPNSISVIGNDCVGMLESLIDMTGDFEALDDEEIEYTAKFFPYLVEDTIDKQVFCDVRGWVKDEPALLTVIVCAGPGILDDDGEPYKYQMFANCVKTELTKGEAFKWLRRMQKQVYTEPNYLMDELTNLRHLYEDVNITDVRWEMVYNPISKDAFWMPSFLIVDLEDEED